MHVVPELFSYQLQFTKYTTIMVKQLKIFALFTKPNLVLRNSPVKVPWIAIKLSIFQSHFFNWVSSFRKDWVGCSLEIFSQKNMKKPVCEHQHLTLEATGTGTDKSIPQSSRFPLSVDKINTSMATSSLINEAPWQPSMNLFVTSQTSRENEGWNFSLSFQTVKVSQYQSKYQENTSRTTSTFNLEYHHVKNDAFNIRFALEHIYNKSTSADEFRFKWSSFLIVWKFAKHWKFAIQFNLGRKSLRQRKCIRRNQIYFKQSRNSFGNRLENNRACILFQARYGRISTNSLSRWTIFFYHSTNFQTATIHHVVLHSSQNFLQRLRNNSLLKSF